MERCKYFGLCASSVWTKNSVLATTSSMSVKNRLKTILDFSSVRSPCERMSVECFHSKGHPLKGDIGNNYRNETNNEIGHYQQQINSFLMGSMYKYKSNHFIEFHDFLSFSNFVAWTLRGGYCVGPKSTAQRQLSHQLVVFLPFLH